MDDLNFAIKKLELVYNEVDVFSSNLDTEYDLNKKEVESQVEALESMINDIEGFIQEIRNVLDF